MKLITKTLLSCDYVICLHLHYVYIYITSTLLSEFDPFCLIGKSRKLYDSIILSPLKSAEYALLIKHTQHVFIQPAREYQAQHQIKKSCYNVKYSEIHPVLIKASSPLCELVWQEPECSRRSFLCKGYALQKLIMFQTQEKIL